LNSGVGFYIYAFLKTNYPKFLTKNTCFAVLKKISKFFTLGGGVICWCRNIENTFRSSKKHVKTLITSKKVVFLEVGNGKRGSKVVSKIKPQKKG
jgi:hypothetical protein